MNLNRTIYIYTDPTGNKSSYWGRVENGYIYEGEFYGQRGFRYRLTEENSDGERFLYEGLTGKNLAYRVVQDKYNSDVYYFYEGMDYTHYAFVLRGDKMYRSRYGNDSFMFRLKEA